MGGYIFKMEGFWVFKWEDLYYFIMFENNCEFSYYISLLFKGFWIYYGVIME